MEGRRSGNGRRGAHDGGIASRGDDLHGGDERQVQNDIGAVCPALLLARERVGQRPVEVVMSSGGHPYRSAGGREAEAYFSGNDADIAVIAFDGKGSLRGDARRQGAAYVALEAVRCQFVVPALAEITLGRERGGDGDICRLREETVGEGHAAPCHRLHAVEAQSWIGGAGKAVKVEPGTVAGPCRDALSQVRSLSVLQQEIAQEAPALGLPQGRSDERSLLRVLLPLLEEMRREGRLAERKHLSRCV